MLKEKLQSLGLVYSTYELPRPVFNCLDDLTSKDAIIIYNPKELNLSILQTNSIPHFYLGFDNSGVLESNGIIPVNNHAGSNTLGLSATTIVIFKDLEQVNHFLKEWFNNSDIHFFKIQL